MTWPKPFLIALLAGGFLFSSTVLAQNVSNGGSVYSRFGVGERLEFGTSQAVMMGLTGVGIRSGLYNGLSNPAAGSDQALTTFAVSGSLAGIRSTDDLTSDASTATNGDIAALQLGIPLIPRRLGLTISYRPYSRMNYLSSVSGQFEPDEGDPVAYETRYEGAGGLQQISGGLGVRIGEAVQVGATADVYVGVLENKQRTIFPESDDFLETVEARSTRLSGVSGTFGATYSALDLGSEGNALTIGGAVSLPVWLGGKQSIVIGEDLARDTVGDPLKDGTIRLPMSIRGGLSYRIGQRWLLATDALYEPWSEFDSDYELGSHNPETGENSLTDRLRIGAGVEVTPGRPSYEGGLSAQTALRLGTYVEKNLYAPEGLGVTTYALTGGVSLPTFFRRARIDLGFEVGTRGSTEEVLVRDLFLKGTLTLNFGEQWFVRRRFD